MSPLSIHPEAMARILEKAQLTDREKDLLRALSRVNRGYPNSLAKMLGYAHLVSINMLIGGAGHKVFDAAPKQSPLRKWYGGGWYQVLTEGPPVKQSRQQSRFYWTLRPEVLEGMIHANWIERGRAVSKSSPAVPANRTYLEGGLREIQLTESERDPKARKRCIDHHGCICKVCEFDFEKTYGELGQGFIQVHHLNPLGGGKGERETNPKTDLIPVCPNCHAMIHRGGGSMDPEELREAIALQRKERPTKH